MSLTLNSILVDSRDLARVTGQGHWEVMEFMRRYRIPRRNRTGKDAYRREQSYYELKRMGVYLLGERLNPKNRALVREHYNNLLEQYQNENNIADNTYYFI